MLDSFFRGATNSGTLGFGDELVGEGVAPVLKLLRPDLFGDQSLGDIYQQTRDIARQQNETASKAHPYANFAGNVAGLGWLPFPSTSIKQASGVSNGLGALYGAAYGLGNNVNGEPMGILGDMAKGAGLGALLGGGIYGGGQGYRQFQNELKR